MRASLASVFVVALASACRAAPPPIPLDVIDRADGSAPSPIAPSPVGGRTGSVGSGSSSTVGECEARVLVIFDRSGSMTLPWTDGEPRWSVAAHAVIDAIEPVADRLVIGAILFPSTEPRAAGGACDPVDPIERQLPYDDGRAFLDTWSARWETPEVFGSTPIDAAFDAADDALPRDRAKTIVVLLTDGEPTCSGAVPADERAAEWQSEGVETFVVGLPGAHGSEWLDAVAAAGGTGAALDVGDPAVLTERLSIVLDEALEQACSR